ncbi:glycosyltransferase family 9 protein [Paraburkholderia sartisoli]|uniref:ADP-heptose:LPS heptosyltransferase n=1 Tax=Paraburkholderia sartisoli TaxID=83784 RepID=A0A1H4H8C6_9BURK|nr:ADP-heptose--LPS heptosyltransferase [Paraburkholderia sartisoli]SEB17332.1 ADP-heptose:LPS heptosyltransferase [Paraburkholderia sartisoli]
MNPLNPADALTFPGSLLSPDGRLVASYDLETGDDSVEGYRAAADLPGIFNAGVERFSIDYRTTSDVHVVNGMGVTLGDSIIGLTAMSAVMHAFPDVRFTLYRPGRAPAFVEELYALAGALLSARVTLPFSLSELPDGATVIDVGNHLFWPDFAALPMIDFFLGALGVDASSVPSSQKANRWLADVSLPALPAQWRDQPYVLFCASASTPVRSIPQHVRADLVGRLVKRYDLPVLGFGPVNHARYVDVQSVAIDTAHFLALIRGARCVLTCDTAAVHAAAGFDVPTTAFFTTIEPALRVRDYPACRAVELLLPQLCGIHASNQARDIALIERAYSDLLRETIPLPDLAE